MSSFERDVLTIVVWAALCACAFFCAAMARARNRSGLGWFVLGLLFGPLPMLALIGLPALAPASVKGPDPATTCPDCGAFVPRGDAFCASCGAKSP